MSTGLDVLLAAIVYKHSTSVIADSVPHHSSPESFCCSFHMFRKGLLTACRTATSCRRSIRTTRLGATPGSQSSTHNLQGQAVFQQARATLRTRVGGNNSGGFGSTVIRIVERRANRSAQILENRMAMRAVRPTVCLVENLAETALVLAFDEEDFDGT